jgi:hypothetical protein
VPHRTCGSHAIAENAQEEATIVQAHDTISGRATRGNVSCSGATIATVTVNVSVQMAHSVHVQHNR